ncbi:mechanosensitive ion channel family protein [Sphingomonas koreensis]|nr:mechanosensitive ion channel family protein [Sphingomonas koreensis]
MQLNGFVAATADWFQTNWLQIIIAGAVGAAIVIGLYALRRLGNRLCKPGSATGSWTTIIGRAVTKTTNYFIIMVAVRLVAGYAQPPASVEHVIDALFTIAAVLQGAIWAREIILGLIEHRTQAEHYRGEAITNAMGIIRLLVSFAVFAIAVVVLLDNLGVNVTGLVAGLGVGGIAIGLAAQGIFADLFAALAIIFDRPFSKGDAISYDSSGGTVEDIGLKSTRIRDPNGELRIIANKNLLDKEIINNTRRDMRRVKFALGVTYQTPVEVTRAMPDMLKAIVEAEGFSFVRAGFVNFGGSSLDFEVEFDSHHPDYQSAYNARHAVGLAILDKFNADHIDFAYPTQTSFTAAPDGTMVLPYPQVQAVKRIDLKDDERPAAS